MADVISHSTLPTNLVSYWEMDETSGTRVDAHGSNDLTDNNTVGYTTGKINNAANLVRANGEYLSITDGSQSGLDFTTNVSISCWVNFATLSNDTGGNGLVFINKWTATSNQRSYIFRHQPTGPNLLFTKSPAGTAAETASKSWSPSISTWYHVCVTYNDTSKQVKMYVDGSQLGTTTTFTNSGIYNSTAPFQVGKFDAADSGDLFSGYFDLFGVWSKELSSSEITDLYNGGAGLPYEQTSSIKTVNGLAKASVKTVNGLAIASVKNIKGLA